MKEPTRKFHVDPGEYPFESRWLEKEGARMHYLDEGRGTPLLLLHGNPTWSYLYRKIIQALRPEARLIAPDYPGFGFSDHPPGYGYTPKEQAEWVNALIDHLKLKKMIHVCQDWGGPIGLSVAVHRPKEFAGLVILNSWCWPHDLNSRLFSIVMGGKRLGRYLQLKKNFFAKKIIPAGIFHKEKITPALMSAYTDPFPTEASRIGAWVFPREIRGSAGWLADIESKLHLLKNRPVALIWPGKDPAFGKERYLDRWRRYFPDAEIERVEDASHYIQEDRPDRVIAGIKRILEQTR